MEFSESEVIAELSAIFSSNDSRVLVGIGDDAAVVTSPRDNTVITTDMAVEGVHFRRDWSTPVEIGRRITAANLADIYAMGANPEHLVVAISLTGHESMEWIRELAHGIQSEANLCGVAVIGGDIVRGPSITISMTAIGQIEKPILRTGAEVGDQIVISNLPGWSAAGLFLLQHGINVSALSPARSVQRALSQLRSPQVHYSDAIEFRSANSMCDISDGLLVQAEQMAISTHFVISSTLLQQHPDFADLSELAEGVGADIWDWIAAGGEDHVFMATGKNLNGYEIGEVVEGVGVELQGISHKPKGFTHFM